MLVTQTDGSKGDLSPLLATPSANSYSASSSLPLSFWCKAGIFPTHLFSLPLRDLACENGELLAWGWMLRSSINGHRTSDFNGRVVGKVDLLLQALPFGPRCLPALLPAPHCLAFPLFSVSPIMPFPALPFGRPSLRAPP